MKDQESYTSRRRFLLLGVVLIALLALMLSSCTISEKKAVRDFGEGNAYNKYRGKDLTLSEGQAEYYLPKALSDDYQNISKAAADKATAVSSKINITYTEKPNTDFRFETYYDKGDGQNAVNNYMFSMFDAKIVKSTILYNKAYMDAYDIETKTHIALHEMGHTLGLGHITEPKMRTKTVMYIAGDDKDNLTDYTEFDKHNIVWNYGI
jgi:hypothetical protein